MAFITTEQVSQMRKELKLVIPKGWKWSFTKEHHTSIHLVIIKADVDFLKQYNDSCPAGRELLRGDIQGCCIRYALDRFSGRGREILEKCLTIMDNGNHNRSDIMSDYFDVGWYINMKIGDYGRPFELITTSMAA